MGWLSFIALGVAGVASMRAALDQGDLDEAARQGALAGPAVVEQALVAPDRPTRLAAIAATPITADRIELLAPLARAATDPDRRIAIPAALAARAIAIEFAQRDLPDDLAAADLAQLRDAWAALALDRERWITLRVLALDTAAAIDRLVTSGIGADLPTALADPDPAFRRAAIALAPMPVPAAMRPAFASVVAKDIEPAIALAAAAVLCADLAVDPAKPVLGALGSAGIVRLRNLVTIVHAARPALRDAARCLAADKTPESAAALRKMRVR
jgi:hypothetical protein